MGNRLAEAYVEINLRKERFDQQLAQFRSDFNKQMSTMGPGASAAIQFRLENELRRKALEEEKQSDLEKQRLSAVRKQRQLEDDQTRERMIAGLRREAEATQFFNRLMAQNLLPPRMDGRVGPGGAGSGRAANPQGLIQLSYGFQDLATVMGAGGSFQQGMVAMSNNLGAMLTMTGSLAGAFGGLAITLGALALPKIVDYMSQLWKEADHSAEKVRGLAMAFEQFERTVHVGVNVAGFRAGLQGDFGELRAKKGGRADEQAQVVHGFRDFANQMDQEEKRMKVEDVKANATIQELRPKIEELDRQLLQSKQAREFIEATTGAAALLPGRPAFPQGILKKGETDADLKKHVLTEGEEKAISEERERLSKHMASAQDILKEDVEKRKVIAKARIAISRDLAAEEAKNAQVEKNAFDKRMNEKMAEAEENEFDRRRMKIDEEKRAALAGLQGSGLDADEVARRRERIHDVADEQHFKVTMDERRSQNRFMSRLEAQQKGTGAVAAIRDRLADDLEHIDRLFPAGPERDQAKEQARATAFAENRRIINDMRPKGGDFLGIADLASHLQSTLLKGNPDEKAIRDNTFKAAELLEKQLEKMAGPVLGVK